MIPYITGSYEEENRNKPFPVTNQLLQLKVTEGMWAAV